MHEPVLGNIRKNDMDRTELNLGPFNHCADDISNIGKAEYPSEFYVQNDDQHGYSTDSDIRVFYYQNPDTHQSKALFDKGDNVNSFEVPIFELTHSLNGDDSQENRDELMRALSFMIIDMIYNLANLHGIKMYLGNIVIPTRKSEVYYQEESGMLYGYVELGIAVFERK
jgi:hypothetical protein